MRLILFCFFTLFLLKIDAQTSNGKSTHTVYHIVKMKAPEVEVHGAVLNKKQLEISRQALSYTKPSVVNQHCNWYKLESFEISVNLNGKVKTAVSNSSEFYEIMTEIQEKVSVGSFVTFDQIKISDGNGKIRKLKSIKLKIKA